MEIRVDDFFEEVEKEKNREMKNQFNDLGVTTIFYSGNFGTGASLDGYLITIKSIGLNVFSNAIYDVIKIIIQNYNNSPKQKRNKAHIKYFIGDINVYILGANKVTHEKLVDTVNEVSKYIHRIKINKGTIVASFFDDGYTSILTLEEHVNKYDGWEPK